MLRPSLPATPSTRRIKVSLYHLIDELLASLQPLARKRNNILQNGVPQGLCFMAEKNLLAFVLGNLITSVVSNRQDDHIQVETLVDDDRTMICVKGAAGSLQPALALDYAKIQRAAEQIDGCINYYSEGKTGPHLSLCIPHRRMAG